MIALLLMIAALAIQVRDAPGPAREATGRVTGVVRAADTGRPVAGASVVARPDDRPQGQAIATADEQGVFVFDALPAGRYVFAALKRGVFLDTEYGQTRYELPGMTVTVRPDAETTLEFRLVRGGVIAGRVLDENGEPLPLATLTLVGRRSRTVRAGDGRVYAVAFGIPTTAAGTQRITADLVAQVPSNDLGEFRFFGLSPDEYVVIAYPPRAGRDLHKPVPVYFPGVTDPAQATRVQLGPGQQITGIDFSVRAVPPVKVTGVVLGPDGSPIPSGTVSLVAAGLEGTMAISQVGPIKDGAFTLEAPAGTYVLRARHPRVRDDSPYTGDLTGALPLAIGEGGLAGVTLTLGYGGSVHGRIVLEGTGSPRAGDFRVLVESGSLGEVRTAVLDGDRVWRFPARAESAQPAAELPDAKSGEFALSGIESGSRRIIAHGPTGLILKGVFVGGNDVTDQPLEFEDGTTLEDVRIVFTDAQSPLSVTASPEPQQGGVLLVFPEAPAKAIPNSRVRAVALGGRSITIDSLPAGEYLVVALSQVSTRSLQMTPALLDQLRPLAVRVELMEGHTAAVAVSPVRLQR